ncbi:hypothetical protein [Bacillus taeanensis]|uniref:Uncharacterized protein n=1 Tax=Bacillus taeanensis TaxID=273032 RepID=A0A366XPG0_9BACI|nr:hypothetical protein [Bacillus taeanensis]RBW68250.1 hypothetical protein DS031_17920 [Bacillus taeanensis]
MKFKKVHVLFITVSVILLASIIVLWIFPDSKDDVDEQPLSNDTTKQESSSTSKTVTVPNKSELGEMENAIKRFLTVWYTEKDRHVIEDQVKKNMTDELSEQFFGTEQPVESGGDEHDLVEFEKSLRSLDIYVKEVDGNYAAMYEANTSFRIGENTTDQKVLGKVRVSNEDDLWLISEFTELDVLVE